MPRTGRDFVRADEASGAEPWWSSATACGNGDSARTRLVGRRVSLGGEPHLVIGIMPPDFRFPEVFGRVLKFRPEIWTPLRLSAREAGDRGARYMFALARRQTAVPWSTRAGRARRGVERAGDTRTACVCGPAPHGSAHSSAGRCRRASGAARVVGRRDVRAPGGVRERRASSPVAFDGTYRELAVRASVGATRMRLVQQLLVEGLVLGCGGAALGVLLASGIYARGSRAARWTCCPVPRRSQSISACSRLRSLRRS